MTRRLVLIVLMLIAAGCSDDGGDPYSKQACARFEEVAADYEADSTITAEMQTRAQEGWDEAQYSQHPAIVASATQMLSAVTSGDEAALATAIDAARQACEAAGY